MPLLRRLVGCISLVLVAAACDAVPEAQSTPSLVGAWRLVSIDAPDATGALQPYWGEKPVGLIIYTADGHMAAQLYDSRRPRLDMPCESASPDAARTAFVGLSTYFGTYAVDTTANTVTHTVEGAMAPDWIGSKLVRRYRFLDSDRVELSVVPDAQVVAQGLVLVWQRMPT
jgi:hypothetical protein